MSYEQIKVAVDAQIAAVESFKSGAEKRIDDLESELINLKTGSLMARGMKARTPTLGEQVSKAFDENRDLFEKTRSVRLEIKAASDAITTANGRSIATAGVGMGPVKEADKPAAASPASNADSSI